MIENPTISNIDQEQWRNRIDDEMVTIDEILKNLERQYDAYSSPATTRAQIERALPINIRSRTTLPDGTPNIDQLTFVDRTTETIEPANPVQTLQTIDEQIISLRQKKDELQRLLLSNDEQAKIDWLRKSVDRYWAELLQSYEHDHGIKRENHMAVEINTNQQALIALAIYPQLCTSVERGRKEQILADFLKETRRVLKTTDTNPAIQMLNHAKALGLIPSDPSLRHSQELALLGLLTKLDTDSRSSTESR